MPGRDRLRDAAIKVLAEEGGRGLTHRAVDAAADMPPGTTKNYFPTRQSLLRAAADFTAFEAAQRAAGLPVTPERAAAFTLAMHAAILHLLAGGSRTLTAAGLRDPERYTRDLLDALYGRT
jgi:DNA-binding transcriptional regulator YbjK